MTWQEQAPRIARMAHEAGLCLRQRDAASEPGAPATFWWQLVDGFDEVAHGPLEDLGAWLQGSRREGRDA